MHWRRLACPAFGPRANAAIIEGSKAFSKQLMKKYGIPTAAYEIFTDREAALAYLETVSFPTVIKADGLALGKGVIIAETLSEAQAAVNAMMLEGAFGKSGERIVIEQYLTGPEVSVLSFTDGKTIVPMVSSMDHKRALDGDRGLNTGGMGTVAPNPYYTGQIADICMETIFKPTVSAMNAEGRTFKGCLYFGLMLTPEGPRVIEYNCRFRRSGNAGRTSASGKRPFHGHAGSHGGTPVRGARNICGQERRLRHHGIGRLSGTL